MLSSVRSSPKRSEKDTGPKLTGPASALPVPSVSDEPSPGFGGC